MRGKRRRTSVKGASKEKKATVTEKKVFGQKMGLLEIHATLKH